MKQITLAQYLGDHAQKYSGDLTFNLRENAEDLLGRINWLRNKYYEATGRQAPDNLTSGWRPKTYNATVRGASATSLHITCQAIDLDDNGPFDRWCKDNPAILAEAGLWLEHPGWTDGWCHLQSLPPRSSPNVRVFIPNWNEPMTTVYGTQPVIWNMPA